MMFQWQASRAGAGGSALDVELAQRRFRYAENKVNAMPAFNL